MSLLQSMVRDIERSKRPEPNIHDEEEEDREEFVDLDQALASHYENKSKGHHYEEEEEEDFDPDEDDEDEDDQDPEDEDEDQDDFDMTDLDDEDEDDPDAEEEEDPNRQGLIRTVPGAHLVYKRAQQDGSYEELWIYNLSDNDFDSELKTRRGILGGTDIPMNKMQSPDGSQSYELWTAGNAQLLRISGLPS